MHSECKENLAEMWMAVTEKWELTNQEITCKDIAETIKTSGTGTKRAASFAQQITR